MPACLLPDLGQVFPVDDWGPGGNNLKLNRSGRRICAGGVLFPESSVVFSGANQKMVLRELIVLFGLPFLCFRRDALYHPPQCLEAPQPIVRSQERRFLDVAGWIVPNKIDQAIHSALTAAAFFVKPFFA